MSTIQEEVPMLTKPLIAATLAASFALTSVAVAQQLPPGVFPGTADYHSAPAGAYAIDPDHTAVIAKVSHIGYGKSVFRFDKVSGTLNWDPAKPAASTLEMTVEPGSIDTPVAGFAKELAGPNYLNAGAFPKASFVSTVFRQTDATHGRVDGRLTLLGKTAPVSFAVTLSGAGKGFMGHPRIAAEATGEIKSSDFGLSPMLGSSIELVIEGEFAHK
jgi:polyisoprenoid-binding protein YceI